MASDNHGRSGPPIATDLSDSGSQQHTQPAHVGLATKWMFTGFAWRNRGKSRIGSPGPPRYRHVIMSTPHLGLHHNEDAPNILVMDESRAVLELLHDVLAEEGYALTLSTRLLDIEQIRTCSPALILMERRFEGLLAPSWDVVRRTRQDSSLAHVPIVLSTTQRWHGVQSSLEQNLRTWGVHVLMKPYALDDLLGTIQSCLASGAGGRVGVGLCLPQHHLDVSHGVAAASSLGQQVQAMLFPDGRVVVFDDPLRQLARWHLLGSIRQGGELLMFVRIDAADDSWTALVPTTSFNEETMPFRVPLTRQSNSHMEPLSGWPLFS